jgi:nucleotide-binding universal stress UspA family protein
MKWTRNKSAVLVPFDFTDNAREALQAALDFVEAPSAIDVVYVMAPPTPPAPGLLWGDLDVESMRARAEQALDTALAEAGASGCNTHVLMGTPASRLVEFANERGSDLVVIPSHGRRGLDRWLMGSVAERVVRLAPCPVLVLRAEAAEGD